MEMRIPWNRFRLLMLVLIFSLLQGCSASKKMTVGAAASLLEEVAKSSYKQSDLRVIREGMPAYLMLLDGMVEAWPENERLLIAAAQAYSSFASAFTGDQDKDYARVLYARATTYALNALERRGFPNSRERSFEDFEKALQDLGKTDVDYLFWAASCWGNWIGSNIDAMDAQAELPRVELMMRRVLAINEGFYYGGPHLFMGIWYAARPKMAGGDLNRSRIHFQRAIELGQGKFLMAQIYYAQHYARRAFDEALFVSILKKVLETPTDIVPELTLLNTVAHKRAKEMLNRREDFF
jgi:hypothetical protein